MREPVHTAVGKRRADGADALGSVFHCDVAGLYEAPSFSETPFNPPHTMSSEPVHTLACAERPAGAPDVAIYSRVFVTRS
jgi:hypothetical protein